ncbi:hypothetical protein G9A89_023411 [Geosiphon pyriformis]|nr:hypothetical protein G9A89_023411 [Geosiphon pyriformis]
MARYANLGYCLDNNEVGKVIRRKDIKADVFIDSLDKVIVAYFKSKVMTVGEWKARNIQLMKFSLKLPNKKISYIDTKWYTEVRLIREQLFRKINHLLTTENLYISGKPLPTVYFTGHGIGGALAVLAALEFKHALHNDQYKFPELVYDIKVVTFGQPRIGSSEFAEYVNKHLNIFRVTNADDFVPRDVNPRGEFEHHELEYWISEPDCHCDGSIKNPMSLIENDKALFVCRGFKGNRNERTGENLECNAGQSTSNDRYMASHYGPYFDITMRECLGGDL